MRMIKGMALVFAGLMLVSCGGGKGGGGSSTTDPDVPVASDLSLTLDATSLENSGAKTVAVSVVAVDGSRVALADVPVQMAVDSEANIVMDAATTDDSGEVTGKVRIGSDRANRVITVTATSGSVTRTASFQVTGAKLQAEFNPIVAPGATAKITYTLTDVNSNAMVGQLVSVSAPGLTADSGKTDNNGKFVYTYKAPSSTGNLTVSADGGGDQSETVVTVQSDSSSIPNAKAGSVIGASISANPSVVTVNSDGTSNQSSIRALFIGKENKAIKNIRVRFDLNGDPNNIGGKMSSGTAFVYSDSNGQAIASYVPGTRSSPADGVEIRACWDYQDFASGACPNEVVTTLTVVSEALSVSIGHNSLLGEGVDELTYIQKFLVQVVDASGRAKSGVAITPSVVLMQYRKGSFSYGTDNITDPANPKTGWLGIITDTCYNEDLDNNGVIVAAEDDGKPTKAFDDDGVKVTVEDNANGSLEPRQADVGVAYSTSARTTDAKGQIVVQIEYAKSVAYWVRYKLKIAASGVAGSEGRAAYRAWLSALAKDSAAQDVEPPYVTSPYGIHTCSDKD